MVTHTHLYLRCLLIFKEAVESVTEVNKNREWLLTVCCAVIGRCRSLQLRERCVELRYPPVGDLQSGGMSLPGDDQSAGSRAGGER